MNPQFGNNYMMPYGAPSQNYMYYQMGNNFNQPQFPQEMNNNQPLLNNFSSDYYMMNNQFSAGGFMNNSGNGYYNSVSNYNDYNDKTLISEPDEQKNEEEKKTQPEENQYKKDELVEQQPEK